MKQAGLVGMLLGVLLTGVYLQLLADTHPSAEQAAGPVRGGNFTLHSASGPVSLRDFRGQVVAIYFGYTFCPDACPTALAALGSALKSMPAAQAAKVQPIFISVDPARDSPARMKEYAAFFHPRMVGLVGSETEVSKVAKAYGVFHRAQKVGSAGGYMVDHTSFIYLVGPRGDLLKALPHGVTPPEIAVELTRVLAKP
jgi:protein SCO1/2